MASWTSGGDLSSCPQSAWGQCGASRWGPRRGSLSQLRNSEPRKAPVLEGLLANLFILPSKETFSFLYCPEMYANLWGEFWSSIFNLKISYDCFVYVSLLWLLFYTFIFHGRKRLPLSHCSISISELKKICNAVNFYWLINCLNIGWL